MTTKTSFGIGCTFLEPDGDRMKRCEWVGTAETVRSGRDIYMEHWREAHTSDGQRPPATRLRNEVAAAYSAGMSPAQLTEQWEANPYASLPSVDDTPIGQGVGGNDFGRPSGFELRRYRLEDVDPNPYQTRNAGRLRDGLDPLIDSLYENGQEVPAKGRSSPDNAGRVQLAWGHRRLAGLKVLHQRHPNDERFAYIIVSVGPMSDADMARAVLVENVQRQDLTPVELARGIRAQLKDPNVTQEQVANALGLKQPTISNWMRILELPDVVLDMVDAGILSWSSCRPLLAFRDKNGKWQDDDIKCVVFGLTGHSYKLHADGGNQIREQDVERAVEGRVEGIPTFSAAHIKYDSRVKSGINPVKWRPLDDAAWKHFHSRSGTARPKFDMQLYLDRAPGDYCDFGKVLGVWATRFSVWLRLSDEAKKEKGGGSKAATGSKPATSAKGDDVAKVREYVLEKVLPAVEKSKTASTAGSTPDITKLEADAAAEGAPVGIDEVWNLSSNQVNLGTLYDPFVNQFDKLVGSLGPEGEVLRREDFKLLPRITYAQHKDGRQAIVHSTGAEMLDTPSECKGCVKGRFFAAKGGGYHYVTGLPSSSSAPILMCGNLQCYGEKTVLKLAKTKRQANEQRNAEKASVEKARRALAVAGLDNRRSKLFLLAALASDSEVQDQIDHGHARSRPATSWLKEKRKLDIGAQGGGVDPAKLVEATKDLGDEQLDALLFDLSIAVVSNHATDASFKPAGRPFAELLLPAGDTKGA